MSRSMRRLAILSATALAFIMSAGVAAGAGPPGCYDERTTALLEATMTLDPANDAHFTKKGKPKVAALEVVSGLDISAAERNEVWAQYPTWSEETAAAAKQREDLAMSRAENQRLLADLEGTAAKRDRYRTAAGEAQAQFMTANRELNLVKEKYRAVARGDNPCESLAAALEASIGWRYAGKDEAKRLVACLRAG